jgi:tRNA1(Val) A37 N6-methylase TrmN6
MTKQFTGRSTRKGGNPQNKKTLLILDECHFTPGKPGKLTPKLLQMIGRSVSFGTVISNPPYSVGGSMTVTNLNVLISHSSADVLVGNPPYPESKAGTSRCRSPKLKGIPSRCRSPIFTVVANPPYSEGKPGTSRCRSPF